MHDHTNVFVEVHTVDLVKSSHTTYVQVLLYMQYYILCMLHMYSDV